MGAPMRILSPLLLLLTALAGCTEVQTCPSLETQATIQDVTGNDLQVRLLSGEPAVLHVADATIYRKDPDGCQVITVSEVTTGSNVSFTVDAWAESYPMQGWPDQLVIG